MRRVAGFMRCRELVGHVDQVLAKERKASALTFLRRTT
jgi:hypothetical protein